MSFSLYDATVPSYLQALGAMLGLIDKAQAWCADKGLAEGELLDRRIAPDMYPLSYQLKSTVVHSIGAIEGVRSGSFSPDDTPLPDSIAPLRARIQAAVDALDAVQPAELNGFLGREVRFVAGERSVPFTAENFLMSWAQFHFFFHCTTSYTLLRAEGLPIGKRDFLGKLRKSA